MWTEERHLWSAAVRFLYQIVMQPDQSLLSGAFLVRAVVIRLLTDRFTSSAACAPITRCCWLFEQWAPEVFPPILSDCGLQVRKSSIQSQRGVLKPSVPSFPISCCGMIMLKAELKSRNNSLMCVVFSPRCVRARCRAVVTASSVDLICILVGGKKVHGQPLKALHSDECQCNGTMIERTSFGCYGVMVLPSGHTLICFLTGFTRLPDEACQETSLTSCLAHFTIACVPFVFQCRSKLLNTFLNFAPWCSNTSVTF